MLNINKITNENRLIYLLAKQDLGSDEIEELKETANSSKIDLAYIFRTSFAHGIEPLIYLNIKKYLPQILSPNLVSKFEEGYNKILINNVSLFKELINVANLLNKSSIPFAVIKGLPLTERLYNDIGIKKSIDIDIFVKENDIPFIKNIFLSNGYEIYKDKPLTYGLVFLKKGGSKIARLVEFETKLIRQHPVKNIDYEKDIWTTIQTVEIDDLDFPALSFENELLYLCLHNFHHLYLNFASLRTKHPIYTEFKWLCDINNFINIYGNKINWGLFTERCKRYNLSTIIYYIFLQTKIYLKTSIPNSVYLNLRPSAIRSFIIKHFSPEPLLKINIQNSILKYTIAYYKIALLYFSLIPVNMILLRIKMVTRFHFLIIINIFSRLRKSFYSSTKSYR